MSEPGTPNAEEMQASVRAFVEQAVARGRKSVEIARSSPQPVGLTPKEVLYERGTLRLYHYEAQTDEVYRVPLLLVMATTNKAFIFGERNNGWGGSGAFRIFNDASLSTIHDGNAGVGRTKVDTDNF